MNFNQTLWYFLCKHFFVHLNDTNFVWLVRRIQFLRLGIKYYPINYNKPKTFSDLINRIKNNQIKPKHTIVADKYLVRVYVQEKIGEQYLVPLIGVYSYTNLINF